MVPAWYAGLGVAVLLIDLLTTGGIGIPAVAQSLWLLLALGLDGAWPREAPLGVAIALLAIGLGLSVACHQTSYARVLPCEGLQRVARREYLDGERQAALEASRQAVEADPRSSDAQALLAEIELDSWLADLKPADYEAFETHDALARRMAPQAVPVWRDRPSATGGPLKRLMTGGGACSREPSSRRSSLPSGPSSCIPAAAAIVPPWP